MYRRCRSSHRASLAVGFLQGFHGPLDIPVESFSPDLGRDRPPFFLIHDARLPFSLPSNAVRGHASDIEFHCCGSCTTPLHVLSPLSCRDMRGSVFPDSWKETERLLAAGASMIVVSPSAPWRDSRAPAPGDISGRGGSIPGSRRCRPSFVCVPRGGQGPKAVDPAREFLLREYANPLLDRLGRSPCAVACAAPSRDDNGGLVSPFPVTAAVFH